MPAWPSVVLVLYYLFFEYESSRFWHISPLSIALMGFSLKVQYVRFLVANTVDIHWSATTLKPLKDDMNNIDHFITLRCSTGKPWVLSFMWILLDKHHPSKHCCETSTPLIITTLPDGSGHQQDSVPRHTANTAQEQLKEHNKEPKLLSGPPDFPDPNLI